MGMLVISAFCSTPFVKFFKSIGYDSKKLRNFIETQENNELRFKERCKVFVKDITINSDKDEGRIVGE